jgi:hypothetical protein
VLTICDKTFATTNLLNESFVDIVHWTFDSTQIEFYCNSNYLKFGHIDFGNGYLEINSGTERDQYYAKRELPELGLSKGDVLRFKINIEGPFEGPDMWEFDWPWGSLTKLSNGNIYINLFGSEIKLRSYEFPESNWLGYRSRYDLSNKELDIFTWFINDELNYYMCSAGIDISHMFEVVESASSDPYIKFASGRLWKEMKCYYTHTTKINGLVIDRLN